MKNQNPPRSRVLVVDDQPLIGELLCDVLRDEGFDPVCFCSAHAAVDEVERNDHFAAVITDIDLGEDIDGFHVARAVREHCPEAAVIYVSGASGSRFQEEKERGAVFLGKPFLPMQVPRLVQELLGNSRGH